MGGRNGGEERGRADARNRQFGEIERDPEILLLFQSGIRNLAEWDRGAEGTGREGLGAVRPLSSSPSSCAAAIVMGNWH